jgi:hypothetical protein
VPITARTAKQCFDQFVDHLRVLVAKTLTTAHQLRVVVRDGETMAKLSFHQGLDPIAIPLRTRDHGKVHFYVGQLLRVHPEGKKFRLSTHAYWYRLQHAPDLKAQAAIRWEYERELASGKLHCRHHLQQSAELSLGTGRLDLNKAHVPTGWVTIEEVIRFLIVELGVKPPCGSGWSRVLAESERAFYEDFTSKVYWPPT